MTLTTAYFHTNRDKSDKRHFRLFFPILLAALSKIWRLVGHPRWGDAVRVGDGAPKLV